MRVFLGIICLGLTTIAVMGQSADQIVQGNLFDPDRGAVEDVEETGPVEEELPRDIPVLDGIVTIGNYQRAIFRYQDTETRKLESNVVSLGDSFGGARLLEMSAEWVMISFQGSRYRLTVDSKHEMENSPSRNRRSAVAANTRPTNASRVVQRSGSDPKRATPTATKTSQPIRSKPVVRPSNSGDKSAHRTPFGWTKGKKPDSSKKSAKPRKQNTPF